MKKSIIALAVLASMAAQADNTTIYGRVSMAYTYNDGGKGNSASTFGNSGSRFGIKGSEDLGNGLSAFYKYENRINDKLDTNKLYVGLKGGFGSVSFGKQNLPLDSLGNYADPFNALTPGGRGDVKTSSDNSLVYWTPDMSGFQFGLGVVADGAKSDEEMKATVTVTGPGTFPVDVSKTSTDNNKEHNHVDHINVAAKYEANGLFAGLGYSTNNYTSDYNKEEVDVITLGLGYGNDQFEIGLLADRYNAGKNDWTWARLSGLYNVTPMDAIYLGFSSEFTDVKGAKDDWQAAIGYQHKFSKRTRTWAEYSFADNSEENQLSLGLRTDF